MKREDRHEVAPLEFSTLEDRTGLGIVDHVESVRFELWTAESLDPSTVGTDPFPYPMDAAVSVETDRIEIPKLADVLVRDEDGEFLTQYSTAEEQTTVELGSYDLDLTTAPLKLHLLVESGMEIYRTDRTSVVVDFGSTVEVTVGARSFHERPAGTITITDDVADLMDAVSLFGSALKTTSPERSFPTLRGHPPQIRLGDQFRVSNGLEQPETGVRIVVPEERRFVYAVAPLAYYLGAEVVPGESPRLETDDWVHNFSEPVGRFGWVREADDFEFFLHQAFKRVFFMDCLTRTEGIYPVDLHERASVEERALTDIDFASLYEMPLAERLEQYLDISVTTVVPLMPDWNLLVDVVPSPQQDQILPYLVNDLALIRTNPTVEHRHLRPNDELSIKMHGKQEPTEPPNEDNPEVHDMSYAGKTFDPPATDAIEHAFVGDGFPRNSNKLTLQAFENQLEAPRTDGSSINIHVVCNDEETAEVELLGHVYNDRNLIDVDVSFDRMVPVWKLRRILERDLDFFHFVGEATSEGLVCTDGVFSPRRRHSYGFKSFFLQGCSDYTDAQWLLDEGAYGGVVTTGEIRDGDTALTMGRWMARLLNQGFTLRSATALAKEAVGAETEYVIFGDGGVSLVQSQSVQPYSTEVTTTEGGKHRLTINLYPNQPKDVGTIWNANVVDSNRNVLIPNDLKFADVPQEQIREFLKLQPVPATLNKNSVWSDVPDLDRYF